MNDMLKKNLRTVNYVGIGGLALFLAGTAAFGIYPMFKRGSDDIRAAAELRNSLGKFTVLEQKISEGNQELQRKEAAFSQQEKRLPSSLEASAFNAELTTVAKSAGIRIESMPNQQTFTDDGAYKALPVTIVGSGDWESCYRFLTGIKNMNRLARMDSVIINVPEKDGQSAPPDSPVCQITVRFSTYFLER